MYDRGVVLVDEPEPIQADHIGNYLIQSEYWVNSQVRPNWLLVHARFASASDLVRISQAGSLKSESRGS